MTSADTLGVTIIAEWHGRQHALLLFLLCWVLGSLVVADAATDMQATILWVAIAAGIIVAAALIGGFRGWRIELRLDDSGVTIGNIFRTHRIGWREVDRFVRTCQRLKAGEAAPGRSTR